MRYHPHKPPTQAFVSGASQMLGAEMYEELVRVNFALGQMLRARKADLMDRDASVRSRTSRLFRTWVPVHRDLTKLLHQRDAEQAFEVALQQLARVVLADIVDRLTYVTNSFDGIPEIGQLNLTGATLMHLVHERPAQTPDWLKRLQYQSRAPEALQGLTGNTVRQLAEDFKRKAMLAYASRRDRISLLLTKVHEAIGAEDFAYLQQHLDVGDLRRFSR